MLETWKTTITPFGRERQIRLYLPNDYATSEKRYPVLYMHDGQNLFRDEDASFGTCWGIADYLDQTGLGLIVVGIDCSQTGFQRLDEYAPWVATEAVRAQLPPAITNYGGEGQAYIDWIAQELKPLIDSRYRTRPDQTAMAGSSMGGLISTYAACAYPHLFRRVASVSSAYWFNQEQIEELIRKSDLSGVERFYLDVGTAEGSEPTTYVTSSERVYELLKAKIERVEFVVAEGAQHNEAAWRQRVPQILDFLYGE